MVRYQLKQIMKGFWRSLGYKRNKGSHIAYAGKEFEVDNGAVSEFILSNVIPVVGLNPYPLNELDLMVASVCYLRPSHIFEWGTHVGKSARVFFETCNYFGFDTEIHSIDLPDDVEHEEHPGKMRGQYVRGIKRVQLYQGDGVETSLGLWRASKDQGRHLFFLDGDHEYASVLRELRTIASNVPFAALLVHDTFFQSEEAGYNIGPFMAIQDFLKGMPGKYRKIEAHLGLPGMTLLYQNQSNQ